LKSATKRRRVSFALPSHQIDQINVLALTRGVSKSDVVTALLDVGLGPGGTPDPDRS
jgi:hypothetical protein